MHLYLRSIFCRYWPRSVVMLKFRQEYKNCALVWYDRAIEYSNQFPVLPLLALRKSERLTLSLMVLIGGSQMFLEYYLYSIVGFMYYINRNLYFILVNWPNKLNSSENVQLMVHINFICPFSLICRHVCSQFWRFFPVHSFCTMLASMTVA